MKDILQAVEKHVTRLFEQKTDGKLFYHNLGHTRYVVNAAKTIAAKCGVNGSREDALLVAAWFHDVGYLENKINHEDLSKNEARHFLAEKGCVDDFIAQVERCIEATRVPQKPTDELSSILCDADLYNVSQPDFMENAHNFWNELAAFHGRHSTMTKYINITLSFFRDHEFHTDYGRTILEQGKRHNISQMQLALEEEMKKSEE